MSRGFLFFARVNLICAAILIGQRLPQEYRIDEYWLNYIK